MLETRTNDPTSKSLRTFVQIIVSDYYSGARRFFRLNHGHSRHYVVSCECGRPNTRDGLDRTRHISKWCVFHRFSRRLPLPCLIGWQIKGAALDPKEIIKELRVRPNLKSLNLNHSALGGEGSKVLFRWLAYGDEDGVYEESNDKESCLSLRLPQLTNISLTGVCLGNMGLSAFVGWLERLKKRQQMNMSISPSKVPDSIRGLSLQNVRLYLQFLDLL